MGVRWLGLWLCALLLCGGGLARGQDGADKRVALVIGNGAYEEPGSALLNPPNDARDMAAKLEELGFVVIAAIDQDYRGMREALRSFDRALQNADAGLFYYAGHGMEYRGRNYLFPTDAVLETEGDVGIGLIDVGQVMQVMETTVPTRLLFLDACRNNPLARRFRGSLGANRSSAVGSGLARMDAAVGTFIAYATAPGDVAADGEGDNSPFTDAMLQHLSEPGLEVGQLMRKVRNTVLEATNERQVPWDSSSLRGAPFILNLNVTIELPAAPAGTANEQGEIVFWQSIAESDQISAFEAYIERFGESGLFTPLARLRIDTLRAVTEPATEPSTAALDTPPLQQPPDVEPAPVALSPAEIEAGLALGRSDWLTLQRALAAGGHDPQGVDGAPGPNTRRAIERWQRAHDHMVTGYLDADQVAALQAEAASAVAALAPLASAPPSPGGAGSRFRDCDACPEMVVVPAGSFLFGSPEGESGRTSDEGPQQTVRFDRSFAMGRFEVTQAEWAACIRAGACRRPAQGGAAQEPVRDLGWRDAMAYVDWLSGVSGKRYLLPGEAAWEYAARGGGASAYPWGEAIGQGRASCDGCGTRYDLDRPAPVGSFAANGFGLHDTAGNVAEWTSQCYEGNNRRSTQSVASGECERRVLKGGSYASRPHRLRSAAREGDFSDPAPERGLRVMREL